jgi:hypothetical protein
VFGMHRSIASLENLKNSLTRCNHLRLIRGSLAERAWEGCGARCVGYASEVGYNGPDVPETIRNF